MNGLKYIVPVLVLAACWPAQAGLRFDESHWRLELSGALGIHQGSRDRTGDEKYYFAAECEVPASKHLTLGLRLTPLFYYNQPQNDPIGVGLGLSLRRYVKPQSYRGLFLEGQSSVLVHHDQFVANSSSLNFQLGLGVGYQFKRHWFVAARYEHISNGSIGDRNSGANTVGIGIGYRF